MGQFFLFLTHLLFFCHPELVSGSYTDEMLKQVQHDRGKCAEKTEGLQKMFNFQRAMSDNRYRQWLLLFFP